MENETGTSRDNASYPEAATPDQKETISGKKIVLLLLSLITGGVFIFSAWSKTNPVQYFEYIISSQLHFSQNIAAILARFFIGLEAALGLLLSISVLGHRRWVLKACLALLVLFSLHLIYLLLSQGNDINCGCMGNIAPMSPALSLLKNAGLIAAILVLIRWHHTEDSSVLNIATIPMAAIIIAVPFVLFPVKQPLVLPLTQLYTTKESEHPQVELRKGKHILCFMSLSCKHCRHAAGIIAKMKKNNPSLPFYFALAGGADSTRQERFNDFLRETQVKDIPYHFMGQKDFVDMIRAAGSEGVPVLLWMQDTTVVRKVGGNELNQKEIENWLAQ